MKIFSFIPALIFFITLLVSCEKAEKSEVVNQPDTSMVKSTFVENQPEEFLFVGSYFGNTALYKYFIKEKKSEVVWYDTKDKVILLLYKSDKDPAYFITARKVGKKGSFPLVTKLKFYRIDPVTQEKFLVDELGDGMQVTAYWNDDGNPEIVYTVIDQTVSSYVNKYKQTYNFFGKLIDDEIETFDLTKDGFPALIPKRSSTVSTSGNYGVSVLGDSVYLKTAGEDSLYFVTAVKYNFNKVDWNDNEDYMIISSINLENKSLKNRKPETAELFVYDIKGDSLTAYWYGSGRMNFITNSNLLIFDKGFDRNSSIYIYDFERAELIDSVKIHGGCGLMNVTDRPK
jgi:hypothetical protein